MFSFDSFSELKKLADFAPGSRVCCRLLVNSRGAEWPLSRKFGCDPEMACDLLRQSWRLGLVPRGVIFHVGSQQSDPHQWVAPIRVAAEIFLKLTREGIDLRLLNLGGGFPAGYRSAVPDHSVYALAIAKALRRYFGGAEPDGHARTRPIARCGRRRHSVRGCSDLSKVVFGSVSLGIS
jgi:ornithine decarboxylase